MVDEQIWINPELNLLEEYDNKKFDKLSTYAEENKLHLMHMAFCKKRNELSKSLVLGSYILKYFEKKLHPSASIAFKLGALYGHIECLEKISYEESMDEVANRILNIAKSEIKDSTTITYVDDIIHMLVCVRKRSEIINEINIGSSELSTIISALENNQLVNVSNFAKDEEYVLTDLGIRIERQLRKV